MLRNLDIAAAKVDHWESTDILIVGGGIAGLAAGWELQRKGHDKFVLLELEDELGGTSRGSESAVTSYPWGAHYLPAPMASNRPLIDLLDEMGIVSGYDQQGSPQFYEENLCRDPSERSYCDGSWHEDLGPSNPTDEERAEWGRFREEIERWVAWRDDQGRRAFGLPIATCSDAPILRELDRLSMSEWMQQRRFDSRLVQWEVDYACRDDYGTTPDTTSAWAGLFYFASRVSKPGESSQPFLTWPEGNGRLVRHMAMRCNDRIRRGKMAVRIEPLSESRSECETIVFDSKSESMIGYRSKRVLFAAPHYVAAHVVAGYRDRRSDAIAKFTYAPWLVANLHLTHRPVDRGFPTAWDNVILDSRGLGYVCATHQSGRDHGPTVWTYYLPLCDQDPKEARNWLEQLSWSACAELVLADLEQAHAEIRQLVERLDVMYWGHAMIRPVPNFIHSAERLECQTPFHGVHFANTDLSGVALMEEAFHHGLRAAHEVIASVESQG